MEIFNRYIGDRLIANALGSVPFSVRINAKVLGLEIKSKRVIEISKINLGCATGSEFSIDCSGGGPANSDFYLSKWNAENEYFVKIIFDDANFIDRFSFYNNCRSHRSEWIYYSSVVIWLDSGEKLEYQFDSQFSDFYESITYEWGGFSEKKSMILYNILTRSDSARSFKELVSIRSNESTVDFDRFHDLITKVLAPASLTPHGYRISLENRISSNLEKILADFSMSIKNCGYDTFINSGTLLGSIRNGTFISHDDDVDFGILLKSDNWEDLYKEIQFVEDMLRENKLIRGPRIGAENGIFHWKLKYVESVSVDLFPCWIIDEKLYIWPYCFGDVSKEMLIPFSSQLLGDTSFNAPRVSDVILSLNYGPDFMIPDPLFKFDWRTAHQRFSTFTVNLKRILNDG